MTKEQQFRLERAYVRFLGARRAYVRVLRTVSGQHHHNQGCVYATVAGETTLLSGVSPCWCRVADDEGERTRYGAEGIAPRSGGDPPGVRWYEIESVGVVDEHNAALMLFCQDGERIRGLAVGESAGDVRFQSGAGRSLLRVTRLPDRAERSI